VPTPRERSDAELIAAFESGNLPASEFHHADHIRVGWIYLRDHPLLAALPRFVAALKNFAAAKGAHGLYHETITCAFLLLIHERMQQRGGSFADFRGANEDLFTWKPSILDRYYRPETLASEEARRTFVHPDRVAPAAGATRV
jgi:hypothetical protein